MHILAQYHIARYFPGIALSVMASTKQSAVEIWEDKHNEIMEFYPSLRDEIKSANFSKDTGEVVWVNTSKVDALAMAQTSKGKRRRRGGLEESNLIDKDIFEDAVAPIFNVPRKTLGNIEDPTELNGQINRYTTSGYKNSDEYEVILNAFKDMVELKGSYVFGSDWRIPVHFGRQKMSVVNAARRASVVRFRTNYLCEWVGVSDGGLVNISKLIKARTLGNVELRCPRDKRGNLDLCEYAIGVDVARSSSESNNKTAIVVLKIIRNQGGSIRQVQLVNIVIPPNGLNFEEQSIIIKRVFYQYGGDLDLSKSRVKAIIVDSNSIGQGVLEELLKDNTDPETNEELGCFATINTDDKAKSPYAPEIVYALKSQGINGDIIRVFIDYVESGKLKLMKPFDEIKEGLPKETNTIEIEQLCANTQFLIDEVSNLKLKKTSTAITVEQVVRRIDKDRYSSLAYCLYYISLFLDKAEDDDTSDEQLVFY
jgi:ribonucleoside-diphosphate reductase alpha chain